ncbi:DNA polymerase Y family protein [Pollutibacter soli]|uniref:Y-family DNA polymerase n=1 Tax=Pollutibacter soli TaxID=3034157 RepID=UPI0030132F4A
MAGRFVSIWFRYLKTDCFTIRNPLQKDKLLVFVLPDHGRMVISTANALANEKGIVQGMVLADARAVYPSIEVINDNPSSAEKLLKKLAQWCIRYSPSVAVDLPDGIILDAKGCAHLWGGEEEYLKDIVSKLKERGYQVRVGMADTIGAAWALARYGLESPIAAPAQQQTMLLPLPAIALRLEEDAVEKLNKLGLRRVKDFMHIPSNTLRRRFGKQFIKKINQALGYEIEMIIPEIPVVTYQERLPCLEPISTATGIEIALKKLIENICSRLIKEEKGLRKAKFKAFRIDNKIEEIEIGTNRPSSNTKHLFKLFENKLTEIEPALGIELFILEAPVVEDISILQENLWLTSPGLNDVAIPELLDRISGKLCNSVIRRFVPDEHYWPERSCKAVVSLDEKPASEWPTHKPRPIQLLSPPELIEVTAPIPDYPPMLFRHKSVLHKIVKADGPERIEQEWWLQDGQHRDYYYVENETGHRFWLFRLGHYNEEKNYQWFLHGYFA